jgi:sRNA-binding protein
MLGVGALASRALADGLIEAIKLAELYPRCFVAEQWKPHRPIACGIGNQLIDAGIISRTEARALHFYTLRLEYLKATVNGEPDGEVTEEHAKTAKAALESYLKHREKLAAKEKAKRTAAAEAKRAARNGSRSVRTDAAPAADTAASPEALTARCAVEPVKVADGKKRLSLGDLRAAAQARRQAQLQAAE